MKDIQPWTFTCKTCGGHELTVTHMWSILAGEASESWQEWGPLEAGHLWHYDYKEKIEKPGDTEEAELGDFGEFAEDDSDSEPEEYEVIEPQSDPEGDEFHVNCANCDREIEFGWSQLDQHGLILPVEVSDFDPSECWPDPKYLNFWRQKGWLRSGHIQFGTVIPNILL